MKIPNPITFLRSMWDALVYWWLYERFLAMPETVLVRDAICGTCDQNVGGQCQECTCCVYAKTRLASAMCPRKKWGPEK